MTQSIPPVSSSGTSITTGVEKSSKSWWDTLVGFIFADEQTAEPVEPLKEKKIMKIDPDALRQKPLAEKAAPKPAPAAKPKPAEKAAPKPAPAAKPKPAEKAAPKPAPAAKSKPAEKAAPKPKAGPNGEIAVNNTMRQLAKQRLDRLSARLVTTGERLASLEKARLLHAQYVQEIEKESQKTLEQLNTPQRGLRRRQLRRELKDKVTEYKKQIAALDKKIKEVTVKVMQVEDERSAINAAIGQAQKVVDLLQQARIMPGELKNLSEAAEAAELSFTKA